MKNAKAKKLTTTTTPTPKAKDVKCPGCAQALLKGGKCAAHGDPRKAHASGAAATGTAATGTNGKGAPRAAAKATPKKNGVPEKHALANPNRPARLTRERTIKLLVKDNPYRDGSAVRGRFAKYRNGMSVDEIANATGPTALGDIRWSIDHGYIALA